MDNVFAGKLAAECILSKGHNNIAYVARSHVSANANERLVGIQNAFASKGFTLP
jgi:DNA-binding LacI/PurR family transcriptional regulator